MSETLEMKLKLAEETLRQLTEAVHATLSESNGVSDNEWTVEDGKATPQWPVDSFYAALDRLDKAYSKATAYLDPVHAEERRKWANACATASFLIDEFKKDPSNMGMSHLHRNIADAIYGTLKQTAEEREAGKKPQTMNDVLGRLVSEGKLVKLGGDDEPFI